MRRAILLVGVLLACSATALADFSLVETTNLTGGSMMGAMKMAGRFGGNAFNNMRTQVHVSGDQMARIDENAGTIINLKDRTITNIDYKRGEYSVITFDELKQAQAKASAKMAKKKKDDSDGEMKFAVDVKDPGRSAMINGVNAKEIILLIMAETVDKKKNDSMTMSLATNMWTSADVPGYGELQNFYRRMSESMAWNPSNSMLSGIQQGFDAGDSMAKLQEHAAKLEGAKVKQILRMGSDADGLERISQEDQEKVAAAQEQNGGGSGLLKGALGGFGGFGRKKDRDPEPQQSSGPPTSDQVGVIMELTTLYSDFSNATVAADKFRPDPSFKQVESKMLKQLSK